MSDKHLEELSALVDGEVSELEMHRVLGGLEKDPAMGDKWARYQLVSAVLKGESHGRASAWQSMDLSARVADALEQEPVHHQVASKKRFGAAMVRPFANVAVAASVSAAVILGWQTYTGQAVQVGGPASGSPASFAVVPASNNGLMQVSESSGGLRTVPVISSRNIIRYNPEADDQLNEYLISHSSNAAMNTASGFAPYARVVTIKPTHSQMSSGLEK